MKQYNKLNKQTNKRTHASTYLIKIKNWLHEKQDKVL